MYVIVFGLFPMQGSSNDFDAIIVPRYHPVLSPCSYATDVDRCRVEFNQALV